MKPEPVCIFFTFFFWFSLSPFAKESAKQKQKEKTNEVVCGAILLGAFFVSSSSVVCSFGTGAIVGSS